MTTFAGVLPTRLSEAIRRFSTDRRGVAAVEMALATPLLLVLLLGTSQIASMLSTHYRASQLASTVADAIARYETTTAGDVEGIFDASSRVLGSRDFKENGYIILSSVATASSPDDPTVAWQCAGGGEAERSSRVGEAGEKAELPGDLVIDADDNVIVAEVFYEFEPLFDTLPIDSSEIYKFAVFRPRLGALTSVPGC